MSKGPAKKPDLEVYSSLIRDHPLEIAALNQFSTDLFAKAAPSEITNSILGHLGNLLPIKVAFVLIYNPVEQSLKATDFLGLAKSKAEKIKISLTDSPIGVCAKKQKPLFVEEIASSRHRKALGKGRSFLVLPIKVAKGRVGAVVAYTNKPARFDIFSREILIRFSLLAEQALSNAVMSKALQEEILQRKQVEEALKKAHDELETRVEERTAELSRANTILREQIARRQKVEEELIKLSGVVEKTADSVIITDRQGFIEYVNPSFEKLTGYKKEEVVGKTPRILKSGKMNPEFYSRLWQTILSGRVFRGEFINKKKNGELYYVERTITPLKNKEGEITHLVATGRNITERKLTEEVLKASEEKYSTLVERSNDGIVIIQDGLLKFVNQKSSEITGISINEAIGRPFLNFVSPEYRKLVLERYKRRLAGEKVLERYEIEILSRQGKKIPVEISASLIDYEGRPADMAILRDITQRREVEARLEEERKKMEVIFETTKEGLALYDQEGRVVDINPALEELFGVKRNIIGVTREEIVKNRSRFFKYELERFDDSLKTQKEVYLGKTVSNVLMKIYSHPPKYLEADYVPIKNKQGKTVGMSASFRDVTLLKNQAEKIAKQLIEVERQKNRWEAVFGNVEEGVLIMDKELRIINANAACELMSGYTEKEMVGRKYYDVFGCHDRSGSYFPEFDPLSKVLTTKEAIPYDEHLHGGKNGDGRWVGVSYTPIVNESGDIEQIISVIRDITAIKELEKAKSEFVSVASHELRTPLTVVNGYLSLLLSGDLGKFDDPGFQANFRLVLDKVYDETRRLTKLVEELLNVSRIEDGRIKLALRKVSMVETINEVVKEFKVLAEEKNIRLQVKENLSGAESFYVMADKDKLKQVLVNLIDNAIKYTDADGKVTVECFTKNSLLYTQVKDTGIGIPPNILPRVFEKFQQGGGSSYLKENKGTGLGLFVVKSLVELHQGKIWVDSTVGQGTKFTFTLPLVAAT